MFRTADQVVASSGPVDAVAGKVVMRVGILDEGTKLRLRVQCGSEEREHEMVVPTKQQSSKKLKVKLEPKKPSILDFIKAAEKGVAAESEVQVVKKNSLEHGDAGSKTNTITATPSTTTTNTTTTTTTNAKNNAPTTSNTEAPKASKDANADVNKLRMRPELSFSRPGWWKGKCEEERGVAGDAGGVEGEKKLKRERSPVSDAMLLLDQSPERRVKREMK
jgi:hypothetical protein